MSEITLSEAGMGLERARHVAQKVLNSYGAESAEALVAERLLLNAQSLVLGLGGDVIAPDDYDQQMAADQKQIVSKLNNFNGTQTNL